MKQNCKWVAALFTAASATLAFGWPGSCDFGPFSSSSCGYSSCGLAPVGERVIVYRPSYTPCGCSSYVAPVGEWTPIRVMRQPAIMPVGERFTTTVRVIRYQPVLQPVGERFTTVRVIRYQNTLQPVGERLMSCKLVKHHKVIHKKTTLMPVGERTIIKTHKVLKPVGQRVLIRTTTFRSPSCGCL